MPNELTIYYETGYNVWDPATTSSIVTNCLNKALDCGVGLIGGGKEIYY